MHLLRGRVFRLLCALLLLHGGRGALPAARPAEPDGQPATARKKLPLMRVGAAQPRARVIDYRLKPADVLAQVDHSLEALEAIVDKAARAGCDMLALPEDTLGLS